MVVITLVGQQNCVAGGICGGGEERKLPFRTIVPVERRADVRRIDPVEDNVICCFGEMKHADLTEAVPLQERPDAAVGRMLRDGPPRLERIPTAGVWNRYREFECPVAGWAAIGIAGGQVIRGVAPPFLIPGYHQGTALKANH